MKYFFNANGYYAFLTHTSVVGHNNNLVRVFGYIIYHNHQFFCATCQYRDDTVASFLECCQNRENGCDTDTTTSANHRTIVFYVRCLSQWTNNVEYFIAWFELAQFGRRESHLLYYHGESAFFRVSLSNSIRHAFAVLVYAYNYKVTCPAAACYERCFYNDAKNLFGELLFADNLVHVLKVKLFIDSIFTLFLYLGFTFSYIGKFV